MRRGTLLINRVGNIVAMVARADGEASAKSSTRAVVIWSDDKVDPSIGALGTIFDANLVSGDWTRVQPEKQYIVAQRVEFDIGDVVSPGNHNLAYTIIRILDNGRYEGVCVSAAHDDMYKVGDIIRGLCGDYLTLVREGEEALMLTKVGVTGKIGAGKDHIAGILIVNHQFEIFRNSGALKDMTRAYLRHRRIPESMIERFIEGDLKEQPHPVFDGKSCREFMQWLGSSGRNHFLLDLWVNATADHGYPDKAVCTDVRYDNEAIALKQRGFVIWHKEGRPGKDRSGEIHAHESEAGISRELVDEFIPYMADEEMLRVYISDLLYKYEIAPQTFGPLDR